MNSLSTAPRQDFALYIARSDTRWIEREPEDSLAFIYESGYLPYSGAKDLHNIFYSARSARIVLPEFCLTSENRRIAGKFDGQFTKERVAWADFKPDEKFYDFCLTYFARKHGQNAMPHERLETILNSGLITSALIDQGGDKPAAYVLEVAEGDMAHYWFSFYDLAYVRQSLGLWLMLDALQDSKARNLKHYYLGTVYGERALYKTNFKPLEWWDNTRWSRNIQKLKAISRSDS